MKKIRILALILALLMLPLGMLVSCNDDPDVDDGGDDDGGSSGGGTSKPTTSTSSVDDGTKAGYLCYFNFDGATVGDFKGTDPYTIFNYISNGSSKAVIGRRDIGGKKGGYLGIERLAVKENPYYNILVNSYSGFGATHVIYFDVYMGDLIKDDIYFYGRKGSGIFCEFLRFRTDKVVMAGGKYTVYETKASGEWVSFALAINDREREFDVYVNGVKTLVRVPYNNSAYEDWDTQKIDKYRFYFGGSTAEPTELRIDNFAISSGTTPIGMSESNVTYTDIYTERNDILNLADVATGKETVFDIYSNNDTLLKNVKKGAYESSKLLMSNSFSLAKMQYIGKTGIGTDLQYDYGVEKGSYKYGANIGGNTFYNIENKKSFEFRADVIREGVEAGKLIVIDENGKQGTYSLDGDASFTKITIEIDGKTTYAVYKDGVFKTTGDDFDPDGSLAIAYKKGSFHGKDYSYKVGEDVSIVFSPDQIKDTADFKMYMKDADIDINESDIELNEAMYEEMGIIKLTADGKKFMLVYGAAQDAFTLYSLDENNTKTEICKLSPPAIEEVTVSEDDELVLHYQSFGSGSPTLKIPVAASVLKSELSGEWEYFCLDLYLTDGMKNFSFGLYLHCGTDSYYYYALKFTNVGLQNLKISLSEFTASGDPDINNLTSVEFKMSGTQGSTPFGPVGDTNSNEGNDGYDFYIVGLGISKEKIAEVEGPSEEGNDDCGHQSQEGISYLVPVEDFIDATCTSIGYYALRCTECGATVIDETKSIVEAKGHDTVGQTLHTQYPSCNASGYTYRFCNACNEEVVETELAALAHSYKETLNNAAGTIVYKCENCGDTYENAVASELMSGMEKYNALPTGSKYFLTYEGHNDKLSVGSFEAIETGSYDNGSLNVKYGTFKSTKIGGEYAFKYTKGDSTAISGDVHNPYFDINVGFDAGTKFVYEFSIMLGDKNDDGKYGILDAQIIDRSGSATKWINFFNINNEGKLVFVNDTTEIQLSDSEFTNVAVVIDPAANLKTVYINGVYKTKSLISSTAYPTLKVNQVRIEFNTGKKAENTYTSYYYNYIYAYEANAPLCLINTELVSESKGNIGLYESGTPDENAVSIDKLENVFETKALYLRSTDKTGDYTFSFTLSASNALKDGVLLKGTKLDDYNTLVYANILTVKGGYIYYMDIYPIYKLGDEVGDVEIKLYCEDYLSRVTVTVNGTEILTKNRYEMSGTYADGNAYIRSFTFCADVCDNTDAENPIGYSIKNISLAATASAE